MAQLGQLNNLEVLKIRDFGAYLDGGDLGEVLLPKRYQPDNLELGDTLDVFLYLDGDSRPIATTDKPHVVVGECAALRVSDVNRVGAFLDWGLSKDLFVPFAEQQQPMRVDYRYVVYVYIGDDGRITATSKLDRHLDDIAPQGMKVHQAVDMLIASRSALGYKAVIDNDCLGLIFSDDAFRPLKIGERIKGAVKTIRPDGKVNLILSQLGNNARLGLAEEILVFLDKQGGQSTLTDRSDPELIYKTFKVSKRQYKAALGSLYKQRKIQIANNEIRLLDE